MGTTEETLVEPTATPTTETVSPVEAPVVPQPKFSGKLMQETLEGTMKKFDYSKNENIVVVFNKLVESLKNDDLNEFYVTYNVLMSANTPGFKELIESSYEYLNLTSHEDFIKNHHE